jgi:eukaryotic-like serine/threonine-protein kinase
MVQRTLNGRYQLERLVASGGMGAVWEAHDLRLDRRVAIKVLAADGLTDPTGLERFDREARTVARLAHPNIVAVYDFGTDAGDPYLVMELVEGSTVADLLADGPLALGQALAIAAQTCDGLGVAHAAGIIHRDVKPRNLIITPAGVVKICDFGIARLQSATDQASLTRSAEAMGSSSYMAPEQVNSEPVDARTDLYGLGCTLFAMLTGEPPFTGPNPVEIAHLQVTQPPPLLRTLRPDLPAGLDVLVDDLLAKRPELRPSDAAEVKAKLTELVAELPHQPTNDLRLAAIPEAAAIGHLSAPAGATPAATTAGQPARSDRPARRRALRVGVLLAALLVPASVAASCIPSTAETPPATVMPPKAPAEATTTMPTPSPSTSAVAPTATPRPIAVASPSTLDQPGARTPTPPPPAQTPSPPRPTQTGAPPAVDPITGMRLSIQEQVAAGNLTQQSATDLQKKVDEFEQKFAEGNTKEAARKARDLREKITKLHHDGKLPDDGYQALLENVSQLDAMVS